MVPINLVSVHRYKLEELIKNIDSGSEFMQISRPRNFAGKRFYLSRSFSYV